jgi:hypothetical protein
MLGRPANAERFIRFVALSPASVTITRACKTLVQLVYPGRVERILGYVGLGPFLVVPQG